MASVLRYIGANGKVYQHQIKFGEVCTVGTSSNCKCVLKSSPGISGKHFIIYWHKNDYYIRLLAETPTYFTHGLSVWESRKELETGKDYMLGERLVIYLGDPDNDPNVPILNYFNPNSTFSEASKTVIGGVKEDQAADFIRIMEHFTKDYLAIPRFQRSEWVVSELILKWIMDLFPGFTIGAIYRKLFKDEKAEQVVNLGTNQLPYKVVRISRKDKETIYTPSLRCISEVIDSGIATSFRVQEGEKSPYLTMQANAVSFAFAMPCFSSKKVFAILYLDSQEYIEREHEGVVAFLDLGPMAVLSEAIGRGK